MKHASILSEQACALFAGPRAAKRMAGVTGWRLSACQDYLRRRRLLSLDAAIELAGREPAALAALLGRIQEVRERNAGAKLPALYVTDQAGTCCTLNAEPRA